MPCFGTSHPSPQIANSIMMFHFCELDAAARMRPRPAPPAPAAQRSSGPSPLSSPSGSLQGAGAAAAAAAFQGAGASSQQLSPVHSYAPSWSGEAALPGCHGWMGAGLQMSTRPSADQLAWVRAEAPLHTGLLHGHAALNLGCTSPAAGSEASDLLFGEASAGGSQAATGLGDSPSRPAQRAAPPQQQGQATPPRQQSAGPPSSVRAGSSDSLSDSSSRQQSLLPSASLLPAGSIPAPPPSLAIGSSRRAAEPQLRLALPVHTRGAAKAAVRLLRGQLDAAQTDLAGERGSL